MVTGVWTGVGLSNLKKFRTRIQKFGGQEPENLTLATSGFWHIARVRTVSPKWICWKVYCKRKKTADVTGRKRLRCQSVQSHKYKLRNINAIESDVPLRSPLPPSNKHTEAKVVSRKNTLTKPLMLFLLALVRASLRWRHNVGLACFS